MVNVGVNDERMACLHAGKANSRSMRVLLVSFNTSVSNATRPSMHRAKTCDLLTPFRSGCHPPPSADLVTECYSHDVIALVAFGFDADSVRATDDCPSVSFQAMRAVVAALMKLAFDPLSM